MSTDSRSSKSYSDDESVDFSRDHKHSHDHHYKEDDRDRERSRRRRSRSRSHSRSRHRRSSRSRHRRSSRSRSHSRRKHSHSHRHRRSRSRDRHRHSHKHSSRHHSSSRRSRSHTDRSRHRSRSGSKSHRDRESKHSLTGGDNAYKNEQREATSPPQNTPTQSQELLAKQARLAKFLQLQAEAKEPPQGEPKGEVLDTAIPEDKKVDNKLKYVFDDDELLRDLETAAEDDGADPLDAYMASLGIPEQNEAKTISVSWEDIQQFEDKNEHEKESDEVDEDLFIKMLSKPLDEDKLDESDNEDDKKLMDIHKQGKLQFYTEIAGRVKAEKKLYPFDPTLLPTLPSFEKDFYVECKEIAAMADHEVSSLRKTNGNIKVRGKGCPRPITNFAQCGLPDEILRILEKRDYEKPFPVQMQCIPVLMSGRDLVGVAQTGSGKTLAYLLPLIRHVMAQPKLGFGDGCIALVIVPTRELASQINREASKFAKPLGLISTAVYGGTGIGEQLNALKRGSHIAVGTPGRLIDVLTISNGKVTNLRRTTFVVIDEADRMFDLGFAPQIQTIIDNTRPDRQTCLFSATFPAAIEMLARRILTNPLEVTVGKKGAGANKVEQHVVLVKDEKEKLFKLLKLLGEWHEHGKIIIFVNKQVEADNLFVTLIKYGYHSYTLHGGQDQTDRTFTLQDFKDPRIRTGILISTSVASRGLDVKQVVLVINYNTPGHLEDYIHRVGRTGRAGNVGVAYTLVLPSDAPKVPDIVKALEYSNQTVPHDIQALCDSHLLTAESAITVPKADGSAVSTEIKRRRPKTRGGFGGKGYKFDQTELSRQQRLRKEATKEGKLEYNVEEEPDPLNTSSPDAEPPSEPSTMRQPSTRTRDGAGAASAWRKENYNSGPDPTMLYMNANASVGGLIVDEFQINKYSEAVRSKITNREVLLRISEDTGTRMQIKGHYLNPNAQNTIMYSGFVASTFGLKPLYVEITGHSAIEIQRAKIELRNLVEAINESAPPSGPQLRNPGKYSVI